jgi:serine/threonine protein kinase
MRSGQFLNSTIGDYQLIDFVGEGGMGEVYRAVHSRLGRVVAVKILTEKLNQDLLNRFQNEARIQSTLHHPNIATLYDFIEPDGQPCIIMEYVDGPTLDQRIKSTGSMPPLEAAQIFQSLVAAVTYIHGNGIVHRDIKANNIKITLDGQTKLLDFGIAKSNASPKLTQTGSVIGTLQYLSPEQLKGGHGDARSDIWALGVLLYEMVSGVVPFEAETIGQLLEKIGRADYMPAATVNPSVPREMENVISQCLRKNPSARYQTGAELLHDLGRVIEVLRLEDQASASNRGSWLARHWPIPVGLVILLAMLGMGMVYLLLTYDRGEIAQGNQSNTQASPAPSSSPKASSRPSPANSPNITVPASSPSNFIDTSSGEIESVIIDVYEGKANVYQDNNLLGTTPYILKAPIGTEAKLMLKRPGCEDRPAQFTVSQKREQKFTMNCHKEP